MTLEDIDDLVYQIQQLLVSEVELSEEELIDLAGRHEDYVVETTKWLKSVDALLQRGLRTEAVELAEREPNLNEVVIALDFPELDAWNELLSDCQMQRIPALPEGIAAELNDAYCVSAPVERLLQRHRTAALSRAPLAQRLQILRRLATADRDNPAWPQDIREFEKIRLTQIRNELEFAIRDHRLEILSGIDNELQSGDWMISVPLDLKRKAADAHASVRREVSSAEMEPLAYQLSDVFAENDLMTAVGLFNRFNALNQIVGLSPSDPMMDIAGPALDWVKSELLKGERQQHHERSVAALEAGIDNGASGPELEQLYHEATRHDQALAEPLQIRLNERLAALQANAIRRRRTVIGASLVTAIILMVAIGLTIQQVRFRNSISRHKAQIAMLYQDGEKTGLIQPLQAYFDLLATEPASIAQSAELLGLKQQFDALCLREDGRKNQIAELLAKAAADSEKATVPSDFVKVFEVLKSAESQSLNDAEKTQVLKVEVSARERQTAVQKASDDAFQLKLQTITSKVEALPNDQTGPYDELLADLGGLARTSEVSANLVDSVQSLQTKVQQRKQEVRISLDVARSLQGVTNAVANVDAYLTELERYVQEYPGTTRANDFAKVIESERDLIAGTVRWNRIRKTLSGINFKKITAADAKSIVDDYAEFQRTSGPYAGDMILSDRLLMLQAVMKRRPAVDGFKLLFEGKAISSAFMVETPDGKERYYADSAPLVEKGLTFDSYTTPGGDQTVNRKLGLTEYPDAADKPRDAWLSPQTRLSRTLIDRAGGPAGEDFEALIRYSAERILNDEPKLDPILRMLLVERTLEYGSEGSFFIAARTKKVLSAFAEGGIPRLTNWVNYSDIQNRKLRDVASELLQKQSQEILKALSAAESDCDAAPQLPIGPELQWIGWLSREEKNSGRWMIRMKTVGDIATGVDLVTFARKTPTEKPQQHKVGTLAASGPAELVENIEGTLPVEGRAVFLIVKDQ